MLTRRSNRVLVQGKAITRFSIEHTSEPNVSPPPRLPRRRRPTTTLLLRDIDIADHHPLPRCCRMAP